MSYLRCVSISLIISTMLSTVAYAEYRPEQEKYDKYIQECEKVIHPDGKACWAAGVLLGERSISGVKTEDEKRKLGNMSINYFKRSCRLGYGKACSRAVFAGVDDENEVNLFHKMAMQSGGDADFLGNIGLNLSLGSLEDKKIARELLEEACAGGSTFGCLTRAYMAEDDNDIDKYREFAKAACNYDDSIGCLIMSKIDKKEKYYLIKAEEDCYKDEGCLDDTIVDIFNGLMAYKETIRATKLAKLGCDHLSGAACFKYAENCEKGKGIRMNKSIAKEFYGKACDYGNSFGCEAYARLSK